MVTRGVLQFQSTAGRFRNPGFLDRGGSRPLTGCEVEPRAGSTTSGQGLKS